MTLRSRPLATNPATTQPGAGASAAPDNSPGRSLGRYLTGAFVGTALVAALLLLAVSAYWLQSEQRLMAANLGTVADALRDELTNRTTVVRTQLDRWREDADVQAALRDGSPARLRAAQTGLAAQVPGVIGVGLLTPAMLAPGGDASRDLSFAGLELAREAVGTAAVSRLEAHRVQQPDAHLAIAAPVTDGDTVLGAVHLRLPLAMLPTRNPAMAGTHHLFQQRVGDELITVEAREQAPGEPPDYQQAIPNTSLLLSAWIAPRDLFSPALLGWLGGLYFGALLLLGLLLGLIWRALRGSLGADLDALTAVMDDAQEHRPLRPPRVQLAEFGPINERLRRLLRDLHPARAIPPRPVADLAALAGRAGDGDAPDTLELDMGLDFALPETDGPDPAGAIPARAAPAPATDTRAPDNITVPAAIFRAYDIRGRVDTEIDATIMRLLGRAVGSEARARDSDRVVVGRDQRPASEALCQALIDGLLTTGVEVIDLGLAPTPLVYFGCTEYQGASGAIVTASHNPAEYTGLKVVLAGCSATDNDIEGLHQRIRRGDFTSGAGAYRTEALVDRYIEAMATDVAVARTLKVVIDCGHATGALVAPKLLLALGCEVVELDCDCDGALADLQIPDPAQPRNLYDLGDTVRRVEADLGVGYDGDGDRLGVVDSAGAFISADRVLMLLADDLLARLPGSDIVYDVKCSHRLGAEILRRGGRPVMWKSGHSYLKQHREALGAPLAGELSGHIIFGDRWNGFDDAFYATARLLEILSLDPRSSQALFATLPVGIGTPELFLPHPANDTARIMASVLEMADRLDGVEVNTIDGLRAEFDQGWGLIRASNTQDGLMFRFEADDPAALARIKDLFRRMLGLVAPELELPF